MPFTPTHIAAILPLAYLFRRLPLSALAIGAMIPDLPLFLFWPSGYALSHSLLGILTFCIPMGILALALFHHRLKIPLLALCPTPIQGRLMPWAGPFHRPGDRRWAWSALAVLLGAGSHVLWDSFTHAGRWGVQLAPALDRMVTLGGVSLPGFKLLQLGSTLVLLPAMALALALWLRVRSPQPTLGIPALSPPQKAAGWAMLVGIPLALGALVGGLSEAGPLPALGLAVRSAGAGGMGLLLALGASGLLRREVAGAPAHGDDRAEDHGEEGQGREADDEAQLPV